MWKQMEHNQSSERNELNQKLGSCYFSKLLKQKQFNQDTEGQSMIYIRVKDKSAEKWQR